MRVRKMRNVDPYCDITRITKNNKNVLFYMSLTVPSHFMNQAAMIKGP